MILCIAWQRCHHDVCVDEICFIFVDFLNASFFFRSKCFSAVQLDKRINEIKKLHFFQNRLVMSSHSPSAVRL